MLTNMVTEKLYSIVQTLKQIYKNRKGYVFTQEQLIEIIKFIPDIDVSYSDGIYFVWK